MGSVTIAVVDALHTWPELVLACPGGGEGGELALVAVRPGIGGEVKSALRARSAGLGRPCGRGRVGSWSALRKAEAWKEALHFIQV